MPEFVYRMSDCILIAEPAEHGAYAATLYPALPRVETQALDEAPSSVLGAIPHLRIDTVNSCNLACVFCHSDFSAKAKHLGLSEFSESLNAFPGLKQITMGCAYEPLMGRNFEKFPGVIPHFRGSITSEIVTNGTLLGRKDIGSWVEFGLGRLYVSVYSHIADIYERTGRGAARFTQIEENLLNTRKRFPELDIVIVNPISRSNDTDLPGFCRWAFDHMGATTVDLRRAFFADTPSPGYPASTFFPAAKENLGRSPTLTDDEWKSILESCIDYMTGSYKRTISLGGKIEYDSILLRPNNLASETAKL
jgi:hypothetical protein